MNALEKNATLFQYQQEGIDLIVNHFKDVLLADHPGAGKTAQVIVAADRLDAKNILVICPASLRENWRREFLKWSFRDREIRVLFCGEDVKEEWKDGKGTVTITSYDIATRYNLGIAEHSDILILDEAHYLKTNAAKRTKRCLRELWFKAKKRIAITGTPIPNGRAIEAWPLFAKLCPTHFGKWKAFVDTYCIREVTPWATIYKKSKNLEQLGEIARKHFMIRRQRSKTLGQLPPLVRMTIPLHVPPKWKNRFSKEEDMKAAQTWIEDGPANPTHIATMRRELGLTKVGPAAEYILEKLDSTEHLVVFAHHTEVIRELANIFEAKGISHSIVFGATTPADRQKAVDDFQNKKNRVFLASLLAANTGITLTRASDVIFVEADWVPENNTQGEARIHRISQVDITRSHYLVIPDTLDDLITKAIIKKQKDIAKVMSEKEEEKHD